MNYDVVIIGGGTAGIASALSCRLKGYKCVIIERQNSLSGTQANALVSPFMPSSHKSCTVTDMILENYKKYDLDFDLQEIGDMFCYSPEIYKLSVEQLLLEKGIDILYDTTVYDIKYSNKKIVSVLCNNYCSNFEISGSHFVDASGNLITQELLGFEYEYGDENHKNQACSLRFEIANIDLEELKLFLKTLDYQFCDLDGKFLEFVSVPDVKLCGKLNDLFKQGYENGELELQDIRYIQGFTTPDTVGLLNFNGPQIENKYDVLDPLEYSKMISIGRLMQYRLHKFLKNNVVGFKDSYISKSATMLGIRESRRLKGLYVLNEEDYVKRRKFDDGVARGDWYIDVHSDDLDVEDESFKSKYEKGEYYEIPYRCLVCDDVANCVYVGRHVSCTFKMQSSLRIQFTCMMMGNIIGDAIKLSDSSGCDLNSIDAKLLKGVL